MKIVFYISCLCFLLCFTPIEKSNDEIIQIPIHFVNGYGPFKLGFAMVVLRNTDQSDPWHKTELEIKGVPADWKKYVKTNIWLDAKQFAYQSFKQGTLRDELYKEYAAAWNINPEKRKYSDKPIKCYVYVIVGKTENGEIHYKIDTNNNLDFSDEKEFTPGSVNWNNRDSIAQVAPIVHYEGLRNGKVENLSAPLSIVKMGPNGSIGRNIPQYAEAEFQGQKIKICSEAFNSISYDPISICLNADKVTESSEVHEKEFLTINGQVYQNLGVNIDQQVLLFKKIPKNTIIYSTQIGFNAKPFKGNEFTTREEIKLTGYKGKFLYLEFWGSWCSPCVQEIPNLKATYSKLDRSKIEFLGIANDKPEPLKKLLQEKDISWKQILVEEGNSVIDEYGIQSYPTSFLIDPSGKIVAKNLRGEYLLDSLNHYMQR